MSRLYKTLILFVCLGLLVISYPSQLVHLLVKGEAGRLPTALAQSPSSQIILTWQASNFYPSNYLGKAAAAPNSLLTVSVSLVQDGRLQDLFQTSINWYIDGQFLNRGVGLHTISFINQKLRGDSYFIRVLVTLKDGDRLEKVLSIPTKEQKVVIETPFPHNTLSQGETVIIKAMPYFFNVQTFNNLSFFWDVNNKNQENERGNRLSLQIGSSPSLINKAVLVSVSVGNSNNFIESARSYVRLLVQ